MPSSRPVRTVVRFMLAWFALVLGAAVASPLVASGGYAVVCSADGMRLVQTDDAGTPVAARDALHCPLCVPAGAPPPAWAAQTATPLQPLAHALRPMPAAWPATASAAPPPARGPPSPA